MREMGILKWVIIGIVGLNAVFFGILAAVWAIQERRENDREND